MIFYNNPMIQGDIGATGVKCKIQALVRTFWNKDLNLSCFLYYLLPPQQTRPFLVVFVSPDKRRNLIEMLENLHLSRVFGFAKSKRVAPFLLRVDHVTLDNVHRHPGFAVLSEET